MEAVIEDSSQLRSCLRDLAPLSALPAVWSGYKPDQISINLAEVLFGTLKPGVIVYVSLKYPGADRTYEAFMTDQADISQERFKAVLGGRLQSDTDGVEIPDAAVKETRRLIVIPVGVEREYGFIAAAAHRQKFPTDLDRFVLRIGANLAATTFRSIWLSSSLQQMMQFKDALLGREQRARGEADAAREQVTRILESITDGFAAFDRHWKLTYINSQAEQIVRKLSKSRESQIGKRIWDALPELVGTVFHEECHKALETQTPARFEASYPPLNLWLEVHVYPSATGLSVYLTDITDRKLAGKELARLASIVDSSNDAIIGKTLDGIITSWNAGAETTYGYTGREAVGKPISMLYPPGYEDELPSLMERLARGEHISPYETVRKTKDGRLIDVSLSVSPIQDGSGRVIGASAIARDITEKKQIEEQRKQLLQWEQSARSQAEEANRAKDAFLAMVSHELRTPLNAILGWSRMLRKGHLDQTASDRALETIERNALAQSHLIEDLLDVSRIVTGKLRLDVTPVEMTSVVDAAVEAVALAAEAKNVRVQTELDPDAGPIHGDPGRLQQIVWNLLMNAIKFVPRGGRIRIVLQRMNSHVEIRVSDNGPGINQDFLPYIFDPFRQTPGEKTKTGLGLGLAITRHLVELHGGTIRASNNHPDSGATFVVELPIMTGRSDIEGLPPQPASFSGIDQSVQLHGIRILAVDDDASSRELLAMILQQTGAEVQTAESAAQAVELLKEWHPDILVSDIQMPGEDGYSLIRKIRALGAEYGGHIPAAALTAFTRVEDRLRALAAGYQIHVPKPVEPAELVAVVASLTRRLDK